jgi:hypothetical protein
VDGGGGQRWKRGKIGLVARVSRGFKEEGRSR